jgi:hypothetical protein
VGNSGGNISSPSGSTVIAIPPEILTSTVTLDLWDTTPVAGSSAQLRSTGRSFWLRVLEWLSGGNATTVLAAKSSSFLQPITVTIAYSDTETLHLNESQLAIYRWNAVGNAWAALPTIVDASQNRAIAQTTEIGDFDLQGPLVCPADSQEPNDSDSAATLIALDGTPVSHLFDIPQDEDWFMVDAIGGGKYTVQTSDLVPGVDTLIEIYDQDGMTLLASGGTASRLEWLAPLNGTYFVRVSRTLVSSYGCNASYSISATQDLSVYLPLIQR